MARAAITRGHLTVHSAGRPAGAALARITSSPAWLQMLAGLAVSVFFATRIWSVFRDTGLFRRIGFDWGLFYSQAVALAAGDVGAMYDVDRLGQYIQRLAPFTTAPDVALLQWPSPYPPLLAASMLPLTRLTPSMAFGIWTGLSLLSAVHLLWRIQQLVPGGGRLRLAVIFFTSLPVVQALVQGQPVVFLASAMAEAFLALRRGADFRGGVWLGLLALKPQYGLLLGLFVLWKRRWYAVAGAALGVGMVLGASMLAAGPGAVLAYASGVSAMSDFRDPYAQPGEMVNWRALIVNLRPGIGNTSGVLAFVALSVLTVAVAAWATRQRWTPRTVTLDLQLVAVIVATFLVSYHSHMHGLVLAAVPLAALWRVSPSCPGARLAILGLVLVPTVVLIGVSGVSHGFSINYDEPLWIVWPLLNVLLLVLLLGLTLRAVRWSA